jgi:hypothetical protein
MLANTWLTPDFSANFCNFFGKITKFFAPLDNPRHPPHLEKIKLIIYLNDKSWSFFIFIWIYIYIYIEKKVFYNIEGQLRGLQGSA